MDGIIPGSTAGEDGISFREACLRFKVSDKTLRARIKRGEVDAWQVDGQRGKEWRIAADREQGRDQPQEGRDQDRDQPLVAHLLEENGFLRRQLEQSRQAEEQLRILLLEQARAMQVPQPEALPQPPRRQWWASCWPWSQAR